MALPAFGWILLHEVQTWFFFLGSPSHTLTMKEECFAWIDTCEQSFQALKERLIATPVLSLPNGLDDFVVYSDAFDISLGCILMQKG